MNEMTQNCAWMAKLCAHPRRTKCTFSGGSFSLWIYTRFFTIATNTPQQSTQEWLKLNESLLVHHEDDSLERPKERGCILMRLHTNRMHTFTPSSLRWFWSFQVDVVINGVLFVAEMKVLSTVSDVAGHFLAVCEQRKFWPCDACIFFSLLPAILLIYSCEMNHCLYIKW